jgi:hypothetical protein
MARPAKLEVIRGEVTKVQFTSETHVHQGRGRVINKMRVFLREAPQAKERDLTFSDTTVGVHEGHRIAVARAIVPGERAPVLLALINESTSQREEWDAGFQRAAKPGGPFGPRWKAFGLSSALFVLGYLVSRFILSPDRSATWWVSWPLMLAFLAYPLFWGGVLVYERVAHGRQAKDAVAALHAEIAKRLAPPTQPSAS